MKRSQTRHRDRTCLRRAREICPCSHCANKRRLFRANVNYATLTYGDLAIIPDSIRCDWCRRVLDTRNLRRQFFFNLRWAERRERRGAEQRMEA